MSDDRDKDDKDKVVSLQDRMAQTQKVKPPQPDGLNSERIRDLSVKAVIYPQTVTAREAQELGAAILYHLKQHYGYSDG